MIDARAWYHSPAPERSLPLSVAGLGVRERMPPMFVDRPNGMQHYLFIHFQDAVEISIRGQVARQPRHTLVIWPPRTKHLFGDRKRPWMHTWMYGGGAKMAALLSASGLPLEQPLHLRDAKISDGYFLALYRELHYHAQPDAGILEALFSIWLREISRATSTVAAGRPIPARLLAVRECLAREPARRHTLAALAKLASLSVSQFSFTFKQCFGTSPINYLLSLRLRQALYHLSDHNLNVTEIARKVGFEDVFYFSKQFKKRFGLSPLKYRQSMSDR